MSFNVFLNFTGLCAFVKPAAGQIRVVLVNARDQTQGQNHEPHCAAIVTPANNWERNGRQAFGFDGTAVGYPSREMVAILLEGENLSTNMSGAVTDTDIGGAVECPTEGTDHTAFGWISRMSDIGAGTMNREAFAGTNSNLVLARFNFSSGNLRTAAFGLTPGGGNRLVLRWQFKNNGADPLGRHRALAEESQLFMGNVAGNSLTFISSRFDGQASTNIVLRPQNDKIEAWVVNLPVIDLMRDRGVAPRPPDHHFSHFYRLSTNSRPHVPHPTNPNTGMHCGRPPITGVTNPKCPPTLFDSFQADQRSSPGEKVGE